MVAALDTSWGGESSRACRLSEGWRGHVDLRRSQVMTAMPVVRRLRWIQRSTEAGCRPAKGVLELGDLGLEVLDLRG